MITTSVDKDRPFTPGRKKSAIEELQLLLQAVRSMPTVTPCAECDYFDSGVCRRFRADVPADVRPQGCDHFADKVPF